MNGYEIEPVNINGKICSRVSLPKQITFLKKGYPELPTICRNIIIPDDGLMDYRIIELETETKKVETIIPSKGNLYRDVDPNTIPYTFDKFYQIDSWWPSETIEIYEPFILRDFRGLSVRFNPFQYNPAKNELKVITKVVVEIYQTGKGGANVLVKNRGAISQEFLGIYENSFLNFKETRYDAISERPGTMLIITADAYNSNMQDFIKWKKKKGIYTKIVNISAIGNNPDSIKKCIQVEYNSSLDLTWVLLVGDGNEIAPAIGTVGAAAGADADPVYAYTSGRDYYPDIFISRFSSRNGNATNIDKQVSRSISYERTPQISADWYHKGLGVASAQDGGSGYADSTRCNWLRDSLLMPKYYYTEVNKSYDYWGTTAMIKGFIEAGTGIINYIGHGSTSGWLNGGGFYIADIDGLNNPWMLPFVISVACVVGNFDGLDCYCEASVTAGTVDQPDGFLVHWGSSINQSWVPPCIGQEGAVNLLTHNKDNTFGGICFNGACYMIEYYYGISPDSGIEMAQTWHIFGDASVQLRTNIPDNILVNHNPTVPNTPTSFTVQVRDDDGITPLQDALVCLWIPTQTPEVHTVGYTDTNGNVTLNVSPQNVLDTMWVTITKHNYISYEGYAIVTNPGVKEDAGRSTPDALRFTVYPNPSSHRIEIRCMIQDTRYRIQNISLKIYDTAGKLVRDLTNNLASCILNHVSVIFWEGNDNLGRKVPAGVYFIRLETEGFKKVEKAILLK